MDINEDDKVISIYRSQNNIKLTQNDLKRSNFTHIVALAIDALAFKSFASTA